MTNYIRKALLLSFVKEKLPVRTRLPKVIHRRSQVGDGKSSRELRRLAGPKNKRVVMSGLTNRLSAQNHDDFQHKFMGQPKTQHYVGNDYVSEDKTRFACHDELRTYRGNYGTAGGEMLDVCGMRKDDNGNIHFDCPHGEARTCMTSQQLSQGTDIIFTSTATLKRPMKGKRKPTTQSPVRELVIDETLQPFRTSPKFGTNVLSSVFGIEQIGSGMNLSAEERSAAAFITARRDFVNGDDETPWSEISSKIPKIADDGMWTTGALFDVLAIRKITETLKRINADPKGGRIRRIDFPHISEIIRLKDLFTHTLLDRPDRRRVWSNPSDKQKKEISHKADANWPTRCAAHFLTILLDLMTLPPLDDPIPGIRVLPQNEGSAASTRVSLGHIVPLNACYHTETATWLDATGSSALAQLTHFEEVIQDPVEEPVWDFGDNNYIVKLMHRHDGSLSRWTADRLFDEDDTLTPLGWMAFVASAHLQMRFLSHKLEAGSQILPGELLFLSTKAVCDKAPPLLEGTDRENFKKVNGSNRWEKAHAEVIFLSPASTPRNLLEIVEASDGKTREDPGVWWDSKEHYVLIKNTGEVVKTTINAHSDPLFDEYYHETVTSDFWQGFRLRSQWRDDRTLYIVANNEPLPPGIHPDEVVFVEELGGWFQHITAFWGIAPEMQKSGKFSAAYSKVVAHLLPDRFKDAVAVRDHAKHRRLEYGETPELLNGNHGFAHCYPIRIRLPGGTWSMWLCNAQDREEAKKLAAKLKQYLPDGSEVKVRNRKR